MKKYKTLRELPGVKVGTVFCLQGDSMFFTIGTVTFRLSYLDDLITLGWIEEVEEKKSLVDKWVEPEGAYSYPKLADIASTHYLQLFDEAVEEWGNTKYDVTILNNRADYNNFIRKRLSEG